MIRPINKILLLIFSTLFFVTEIFSITVTNNNDSGAGSFRQAIIDTPPGGTIDFVIGVGPQTITLLSALPVINKQLIIQGLNDGIPVTIDGNNITNIGLQIDAAGSGTEISNLIFQNFLGANGANGDPAGDGQEAIGIFINGANNCSISSVQIQNITGGNGGLAINPTDAVPGGDAGFAAGIRIINGTNNTLTNCLFSNINGGIGGNGASIAGDGGNGGFAAGISLNTANNNIISVCNFANNFTGGNGGDSNGGASSGGIGGDASCILLDSSSNNQITNNIIPNSETSTGGNGGRAGNAGPGGSAAAILLRLSSNNNTITNNNIAQTSTGGLGGMGIGVNLGGQSGNGGSAASILLDNSSTNNITVNSIAQISTGGNGGSTNQPLTVNTNGSGGDGGPAAAILLRQSNTNTITNNIVNPQDSIGGNGGDGLITCSGDVLGTGGNGGDAGSVVLITSSNNEIINNTLTNQTSVGGIGGAGSCQVGEVGQTASGQSGNGGNATVISLRLSSSSNTINQNTVQPQSLTGGAGGIGSVLTGGNGGNGGNAVSVLLADSSNSNSFQENSFFLGVFYMAGAAGPQGSGTEDPLPVDGTVANILVTSLTLQGQPVTPAVANSILTNYIEGNALIFGIDLANGGNNNQTAPQLTDTSLQFCFANRQLNVQGSLDNTINGTLYLIQFFNNQTNADPNQGRFFLGSIEIVGNGGTVNFSGSFIVPMSVSVTLDDFGSATATRGGSTAPTNTSEFSNIEQISFLEPATAQGNMFTICQDTVLNGQLTGSSSPFAIATPPATGSVIITDPNNGLFTYTPNVGFIGQDSFTFIAGAGSTCPSVPATITIDMLQRAIADNETFQMCQDTILNGNLTVTPPFQINSQPTNGTLVVDANTGEFIYTPNPGFIGQDSFTFIAGVGSTCPSFPATVTINVLSRSIAENSMYQVCQDTTLLENLLLTPPFAIIVGPSNGTLELINANTGEFMYTPNSGFIGQDSFTFIAGAGTLCPSSPATITLDVLQRAQADNQTFQICQDTALNGILTVTLPFQIDSEPANGTVTINSNTGAFVYVPNLGFVGQDSFTFIAGAGFCPSFPGTITVDVIGQITAQQYEFTTCLNQNLTILAPGLLAANLPILPVNQSVELQLVANPSFGTVTLNQDGSFVYRPNFGFIGQDSFVYRLVPQDSPCGPTEATVIINVRQCC